MNESLHLITCSYGPDRTRCERLCASVDHYVPARIPHTIVVPRRDLADFRALSSGRRTVLTAEDVLPAAYRQLPHGQRWWLDEQGWPTRGWIMQQLVKLSADRITTSDALMFADSDLQFIRPFDETAVFRDGRLRLHRVPGAKRHGVHLKWHRRAGALLGTARGYAGADYVGQLITWRREHLVGLKDHVERITRRPWHRVVGRSLRFSEYILYGVYVDRVLGGMGTGHYVSNEDLVHCCWLRESAEALMRGEDRVGARAFALLLQSNLGLEPRQENEILDLACRPQASHQ